MEKAFINYGLTARTYTRILKVARTIADLEENENTCDTKFKEGDRIHNKKYGNGTIEKILKCNDKYLFSIQFDEHGRKLLNPQLANIEPIN